MITKLMKLLEAVPCPKGCTRIMSVNADTGVVSSMVEQRNTIMAGSADVLPRVASGDMRYKLAYMYIQFENLAASGDDPSVPTYTPAEGAEYFTNLEVHPSQDFLRVPLLIAPSYTPTDSAYEGNLVTYVAISGGFSSGFWGKPFDEANNSAIFGGALVAAPTGQQQGDRIFARNYPTDAKVLKPAGEQIVMQWSIEYTIPYA
jgi:hypothetical protein